MANTEKLDAEAKMNETKPTNPTKKFKKMARSLDLPATINVSDVVEKDKLEAEAENRNGPPTLVVWPE